MEYFDVLDKNRNYLNKTLPRNSKLNDDEFNQGAEVWVISKDKRILITQRSQFKSHPFKWEAPGGCSLSGETTKQTAIREIKEEIGLDISNDELYFLTTQLYKYQFVDIYMAQKDFLISDLELQSSEIADAKLVTFEEFDRLINIDEVIPYVCEHYNIVKENLKKY